MSPYYAQMTNLPEKIPRVYETFKAGQFSVQMSNNNPFGRIPVDQATDVTVNKDTQTPGGTARFSLKAGAIKRYCITSEYRSAFLGQLRDKVQGNRSNVCQTELQRPRIQQRWGCGVYSRSYNQRLGQPICGEAGPHQHFYCKDSSQRHCFWPFKGIWDRWASLCILQGRQTREGPACKEIQRSNENQQAEDIQQYV